MATFFVDTVRPDASADASQRIEAACVDIEQLSHKCTVHQRVDSAEAADVILLDASYTLFVSHIDRARRCIRNHPLRVKFPRKCFVYDPDDDPSPLTPGVFPSLHQRYVVHETQRAAPYVHYLKNPLTERRSPVSAARHLFSFVGAPETHPVRHEILRLESDRALLISTSARWPAEGEARTEFKQRYADSLHDSKFVLCPRGRGTSSVRLFETLRAGRVPVIVSDDWIAPRSVNWEACSIRVAEKDVRTIPDLLRSRESEVEDMGAAAYEAHQNAFDEERVIDGLIDSCLDLLEGGLLQSPSARVSLARSLARPQCAKRYLFSPFIERFRRRR